MLLISSCQCMQERDTHDKIARHSVQHWAPTAIHIVRTGPHFKRGKRVKGIMVMYRNSSDEHSCTSGGKVSQCMQHVCVGYDRSACMMGSGESVLAMHVQHSTVLCSLHSVSP